MITGNYLATRESKAAGRVVAAAVVSAPWNMVDGLRGMERPGLNLLLNWYLASCLCELVDSLRYKLAGKDHKWDLDTVMKVSVWRNSFFYSGKFSCGVLFFFFFFYVRQECFPLTSKSF